MPTPKFLIEHLNHGDVIRFQGEFPMSALTALKLDLLDRALMRDVGGLGPPASIADHLLVLEMLFRRYAEQVTPSKPTAAPGAPSPLPPAPASPDARRG